VEIAFGNAFQVSLLGSTATIIAAAAENAAGPATYDLQHKTFDARLR
jgi:hypothetical protein